MEPIRLNKYLVQAGVCSRREADRMIEFGDITVNGRKAILGQKVDGTEKILVMGRTVGKPVTKHVYIAYNKPVGVICTADPDARDNIIDAINYPERIFHIGRLDVASSGLILLTNDGEIVNQILRSEGEYEKEYVVTINAPVTQSFVREMSEGVKILGRKTLPAKVQKVDTNTFIIILVEGRNRQIRRMCEAMGVEVESLERIRIMHIELDNLPVGQWRYLTPQEEKELLKRLQS